MKELTKNRVISAFTLGYMLCLLSEKKFPNYSDGEKTKEKIFYMFHDEILEVIQSLYFSVFDELLVLNETPKTYLSFFDTIKNVYSTINEKNHWGDDSFLEIAFLSGSFLSLAETFDSEYFNLPFFEKILTDLLGVINVNIDLKEFSRTVKKIISTEPLERACSRDEIFFMISGKQKDHKSIIDIQCILDNTSSFSSAVFA